MVYDWFNRSAAPDPAAEATTAEASTAEASTAEASTAEASTAEASTAQATSQAPAEVQTPAQDDALEWARQAYARLKAQQQAAATTPSATPATPPSAPPEPTVELVPEPPAGPTPDLAPEAVTPLPLGMSLLEQAAAQRAERQQALIVAEAASLAPAAPTAGVAEATLAPAARTAGADAQAELAEPQLGAFDETFTWSAEVLAAQGKRADQISLEEIDWLSKLRRGLEKTRQNFVTQLLENLGDDPLTPEVLDDLEGTLLRADVGVKATDQVLEALRQRLNQEVVDPAEGIRFLKEQLRELLDEPIRRCDTPLLAPQRDRLNVWLMVGVNGVGKTTTLGKLANLAVRSGYSCLIAAADTFRAAAVQQVQVWGERSGVPVIANPSANADPAAVVYDAIGAAQSKGTELVLVDTAGRLQTKHNLMEELAKVRRIVDKLAPEAAVESLLVLDASQGQNGLKQAMAFASAAGLTGVVITKLDGSARGGVALAVASEAGLPIRFIGAGEGIRDLRPFNSFEFVEALLAG